MKRLLFLISCAALSVTVWSRAPAADGESTRGFLMDLWNVTAEERKDPVRLGGHVVEHLGCLYCHGLGGREGFDNPNAVRKHIPSWDSPDFVRRYPTPEKVRETIREGRFPEKDPAAKSNPVPMPPWGNRLTEQEMDAIIAYIWSLRETPVATHPKGGRLRQEAEEPRPDRLAGLPVIGEPEPAAGAPRPSPEAGEPAFLGKRLVEHLGCLHCHGLGGRQGMENPNAVRKHVPAWDSEEFIRRYPVSDGVRYVIEKGRFPERDPNADGSPVPMPPWGNRLTPDEMDAIIAYIWSLRETPVETHRAAPHLIEGREVETGDE